MNRTVNFEKWTATVNRHNMTIDRFVFSPSEGEKITSLLSFAGRMAGLKALPPDIADQPFVIEFSEDGIHKLRRDSDLADSGLGFSFEEIDSLIQMINACREVFVDIIKHAPKLPASQSLTANTPDIYEGR